MQSAKSPKEALRDWVSKHCPALLDTYHSLRTSVLNRTLSAESAFEKIHEENLWGDPESASGKGSNIKSAEIICRELPPLLNKLGARIFLDAPCGDFNWMQNVNLGDIRYLGVDISARSLMGIDKTS